jgi:hypothetical protein
MDKAEEEIKIYDDLITRFSESNELPLQVHVSKAMYNRKAALSKMVKPHEAN